MTTPLMPRNSKSFMSATAINHWVSLILKLLQEGAIVVCGRERMSTYAYGHAFGLDVDEIHAWHALLPVPDNLCSYRYSCCGMRKEDGREGRAAGRTA